MRENYDDLLARIRTSEQRHGRPAGSVRLLAVSKTFPAEAVLAVAGWGQQAFGENYLQEALGKISACAAGRPERSIEWHFIGALQSNKTRAVVAHFDWVHGVDRPKLAQRLSDQRAAGQPPLNICVQVNISGEASKSGCAPDETLALMEAIAPLPGLRLRGLMALPEPEADPQVQRTAYARVRTLFEAARTRLPTLDTLSMGMSADFDAAIAEGATIVRIGTALFGGRPKLT